jgi:hypothetical protein
VSEAEFERKTMSGAAHVDTAQLSLDKIETHATLAHAARLICVVLQEAIVKLEPAPFL